MGLKIVIVGAVAAGPKCACRLSRLLGGEAEITMVDQDSLISYGGCGIPYFVSGDVADEKELRSTSFHMERSPDYFRRAKGINVKTRTKALSINRKEKYVVVENLDTHEKENLPYDRLMLATGSTPFVLPIPGKDAEGVYTISDLHKGIEIKDMLAKGMIGKAVVIGGGAIGVEMAESFSDLWGVETSLIEFQKQLFPGIMDETTSRIVEQSFKEHNVNIYTGEGAQEIIVKDGKAVGVRTPKRTLEADIVIMAAGVRPRSELAAEAGLQVGPRGGITVNECMQTSDPNIYAAGDCVELPNLITGKKMILAMGSIANRSGRVAADNIAGIPSRFKGVVGSFIVKAFEVAAGAVGLSPFMAKMEGFDAGIAWFMASDRAHFYPERGALALGLVYDKKTRKVLGLQGAGPATDSLLARINAAAIAIAEGAHVEDFGNAELAYAPPFSSAIDPFNVAGYLAENACDGKLKTVDFNEFFAWMEKPELHPDWQLVDVRSPIEVEPYTKKFGDRWICLPYDHLRERYQELPKDKCLVIICSAGSRAFETQVILAQLGITNTLMVPGGVSLLERMGVDYLS